MRYHDFRAFMYIILRIDHRDDFEIFGIAMDLLQPLLGGLSRLAIMYNRSLFIASIPTLSDCQSLNTVISEAASLTKDHLLIILFSPEFDTHSSDGKPISRTANWTLVQRLLTLAYVSATKIAQDNDRMLMRIDVILKGENDTIPYNLGDSADVLLRLENGESFLNTDMHPI